MNIKYQRQYQFNYQFQYQRHKKTEDIGSTDSMVELMKIVIHHIQNPGQKRDKDKLPFFRKTGWWTQNRRKRKVIEK